ncbi:unnamed protein product [Owenia fusiformis]|uniref:Translation factor GUF1 homolog, mitochondrial n=1 Tax=Owenia fusiformis TaxID=6347 RepID=A0A8J1TET5_OWEFU|nr:unnamed protein product [Owenia fusiformis]
MIILRYSCLCGTIYRNTPPYIKKSIKSSIFTRMRSINKSHPFLVACFSDKPKFTDLRDIPVERIRNFSIIAHVDHGKSTLADRLLEITETISAQKKNEQVLDKLQVERERGITVKAQTATLFYDYNGEKYMLNLIDTPGHVDFNYEVARSLTACQGVILLVDANQGIQAQTVANFYLAFEKELVIIPVINKIDLKNAKPEQVKLQIQSLFDCKKEDILKISAKLGTGTDELLQRIVEQIPPPESDRKKPFKGLLFDSWYDKYRGAVANVAIIDGQVKKGDKIIAAHSMKQYEIQETGILYPDQTPTNILLAGQVGYIIANMKTTKEAQVGDTLFHLNSPVEPLPGFKPAKAMVFAGIYPTDQSEFNALRQAIERLILNDSSVTVIKDSSPALGQGWRLGFLGLLHMDVFCQRLDQEHNANVIITAPNVPYKVTIHGAKNIKQYGGAELTILNPVHFPDKQMITMCYEPMVNGTIITPDEYIGDIMKLVMGRRGVFKEQIYIDDSRVMLKAILPLNEIVIDFYDTLKGMTSGYASFDYEDSGFEETSLEKIDFQLNGQRCEELTCIAHISNVRTFAKKICNKLKETIPQQQFLIAIQATVNDGGKIIAREDIKPYRKDVTAKLYGGDVTRRQKLLKRQSEGKKRMRKIGNIDVPRDAFIKVLKR